MTPTDIARKFASLGYWVFPRYKGKNGVIINPFGWSGKPVDPAKADKAIPATNDPSVVSEWPNLVKDKYKSEVAGFGIVGIGVLILDLDTKEGRTGFTEFRAMAQVHKLPQPTMMTMTKSGGLHLFYRKPKKYINSPLKTMAGVWVSSTRYPSIDLRGDGGFVVGPELFEENLDDVRSGSYVMNKLLPIDELPEFPANIIAEWTRSNDGDIENLESLFREDVDFMSLLKRGEIPDKVPKGSRNTAFFHFIASLRNKRTSFDVARHMCDLLAQRVEEPETLTASVDIGAMLAKAYKVTEDKTSPYDIAHDLIDKGLYQITGYKSILHYAILEDNPYVMSKNLHDEAAMKTLLKRYERPMENSSKKVVMVNPITVVVKLLSDENRVDMIGFKPKAGDVFSLHDEPGSKKFLNTYRSLAVDCGPDDVDDRIWGEFVLLMTRLFGNEESEEFKLGMDFIAWMVQRPNIRVSIAPFLISINRGVGKSLLFNILSSIMGTNKIGEKQARMVKLDEISGRFFNPSGCVINLIDEAQFPVHRNMRQESTMFWRNLKTLITAETVSVEIKGGATYQSPNTAAIMLAGNAGGAFPIEDMDRRVWVIDNNSPVLDIGTVDSLFDLVRRSPDDIDERNRQVMTLRYQLAIWKITQDLSSLRAPMTEVKRELYLDSLTDTSAWFVEHFRDHENVFALTPIVSQSALHYVWCLCGRGEDKDTDTFFRDLKRKNLIRPIRLKNGSSPSKQFMVATISLEGSLHRSDKREVLYTTRDHGLFDGTETDKTHDLFTRNCATIQSHRQKMMANRRTKTAETALVKEVR